jgi:Skp family chaperone for outer membrane proteins
VSFFSRYAVILPVLAFAAAPAAYAPVAHAQSGFFMPPSAPASNQGAPAAAAPSTAQAPAAAPAPAPQAAAQPQVPNLPTLPPESQPPVANIGVLSVPEVLQKSTAAQGVQAEIQRRQQALKQQEEAAQTKLQSEQQAILAQRGKIPDADLEAKAQAWQNEAAQTQTEFQEKNQAIQNSGQAALGQIEAELIGIIRQEAQAHNMNLILHREQVALNVSAFDITDETVAEINKLLPHVKVPPSVVTPGMAINPPDQDQGNGQ